MESADQELQRVSEKDRAQHDKTFWKNVHAGNEPSLRWIQPNELVMEFDHVDPVLGLRLARATTDALREQGLSHTMWDHGGKSPHIHMVWKNLEMHEESVRKEMKRNIVLGLAASIKVMDDTLFGRQDLTFEDLNPKKHEIVVANLSRKAQTNVRDLTGEAPIIVEGLTPTPKQQENLHYPAFITLVDLSLTGKHLIATEDQLHWKKKLGQKKHYGIKHQIDSFDAGSIVLDTSNVKITKEHRENERKNGKTYGVDLQDLKIEDVVDLSRLKEKRPGVYQGAHPLHGSSGGQNFLVDTIKGLWCCYRCGTGGTAIQYFAMKKNILSCSENRPGALTGKKFKHAVKLAMQEGLLRKSWVKQKLQQAGKDADPELEERYAIQELRRTFKEREEDTEFKRDAVINWVQRHHPVKTRVTGDRQLIPYIYYDGIYIPSKSLMRMVLHKALGSLLTENQERTFINLLTLESVTGEEVFEDAKYYLAVENGILDLRSLAYGSEPGFMEHDSSIICLRKIPVRYDPEAEVERFDKFLMEITGQNRPDDIETLLRILGYCLWPSYEFQKAFMLLGEGSNGKSVFGGVLMALLGKQNMAGVSPLQLAENRFAGADLHEKMLNYVDDMSDLYLEDTSTFKALCGEGLVRVERKRENAFLFQNTAKFIFCANRLPRVREDSRGFYRRWEVVRFPNEFSYDLGNRDDYLLDDLTEPQELSGILNMTMCALSSLLAERKFSETSIEDVERLFSVGTDTIGTFVKERLTIRDPDEVSSFDKGQPTTDEVYSLYREFCKGNNVMAYKRQKFFKNLNTWVRDEYEFHLERHKTRRNNKVVYFYENLFSVTKSGDDAP